MAAMTVRSTGDSMGDAGEPAPVRPLAAVPDLDVPARRNVTVPPAGGFRRAGRPGGTAAAGAAIVPGPAVMPSRIIPPRPTGTRYPGSGPAAARRPGPAGRRPIPGPRPSAARGTSAARRPAARPASPGPVRLTRRGRLVLGGLAVVVVVVVAFLVSLTLAGGALASSHGAAGAGYQGMRRVVVEPGQTLWSIATAAQPAADPRLVIQQIDTANSLSGAVIYAGEQLWVPGR
jgi:LysM domain